MMLPPLTMQVSPSTVQSTPQPQLVLVFARQAPSQQLSPSSEGAGNMPAVGMRQAVAVPHRQEPDTQLGALVPQMVPQAPQFIASALVSRQLPAQHA
jgi:hypothetical protein